MKAPVGLLAVARLTQGISPKHCTSPVRRAEGLWRHVEFRISRFACGHWSNPMQWVTQQRPKIDRLASPWLVRRFIDGDAEFLFVPAGDVRRVARETGAIPFDAAGTE